MKSEIKLQGCLKSNLISTINFIAYVTYFTVYDTISDMQCSNHKN